MIFSLFALAIAANAASFRGLSAVSARIAWAGGTQGSILRTTDGGATWRRVSPPDTEGLDFRDMEAFDANTAYALSAGPGPASRLYHTSDGGANWRLLLANDAPKGFWDAIAFWNPRRGVLMGDPAGATFDIRLTDDGGRTWRRPERLPEARPEESAFAASGTCLIVGGGGRAWFATGGKGGGRVFRSSDWGRTWDASETPVRHDGASSGIFSIAFRDHRRGIVVGGDFQKPGEARGHVAITGDGGLTWTPVQGPPLYLSAVRWRGDVLVATGPSGTVQSSDGGRTWTESAPPGYHTLDIADGRIWAAGLSGPTLIFR